MKDTAHQITVPEEALYMQSRGSLSMAATSSITTLHYNRWIGCCKRNPQSHLRLFCYPYAGGGGSIFSRWPTALPNFVEVCPVQLPGRGERLREPAFTSLTPLVHAITQAMQQFLDRPFAFFGHSMGATIAFEVARLLRKQGRAEPVHLFVSGCAAPQVRLPKGSTYTLPDDEFLRELGRLNGTPAILLQEPAIMRILLPSIRADFEVHDTFEYRAEPPLRCPITAFGGSQDLEVTLEHLAAWRAQTETSFSMHVLDGDHFFINTLSESLLRLLSDELRDSERINNF